MQDLKASIIILTKNEEKNIGTCLNAIYSQRVDFDYEVIVVDSGSTDKTLDIVRSTAARVFEIPPQDFDHGATRQYGAERAKGEFVVTLVADATPMNDRWLSEILAPFDTNPQLAGVYGKQIARIDADPYFAWRLSQWITGDDKPHTHHFASTDEIDQLTPEQKRLGLNFDDINSARPANILREFPFPSAEYAEDLVWARTVLTAGKTLAYTPTAAVYHSHRRTLIYAFKKRFLDQRFNYSYYGLELYPALTLAMRAIWQETKYYLAVAYRQESLWQKMKWAFFAPLFAIAEISGSFLGILSAKDEQKCPHNIEKILRRYALKIAQKYKAAPIRHP